MGPSAGTLGPFSRKKGRKKALHNTAPSRSGARTCGDCSKGPATCCLWSAVAPVSLSAPGARSSSPSLLGPAGKASGRKRLLPRLRGPPVLKGWQKRRTQLLSVRSRRLQGYLGPQREETRNALVTILTPTASSAHTREGRKLVITLRSCLMPNQLLEPGVTE